MTVDEELRRLRERAYGPAADIDGDEVAVARLERLQNPDQVSAEPERAPSPSSEEPGRSRVRRRLVVALVAAAALAGVGATALVMTVWQSPAATDPVAVVATLRADPSLPWLTQVTSDSRNRSGGVRYNDYLDVAVVSTTSSDGIHCVYVLPTDTGGAVAGGCGAGPFPARAVVVVTSDMPAELTARHPPGTALQFELVDGAVLVQAADRYGSGVPPESAR